jgi:hypothetical protein
MNDLTGGDGGFPEAKKAIRALIRITQPSERNNPWWIITSSDIVEIPISVPALPQSAADHARAALSAAASNGPFGLILTVQRPLKTRDGQREPWATTSVQWDR